MSGYRWNSGNGNPYRFNSQAPQAQGSLIQVPCAICNCAISIEAYSRHCEHHLFGEEFTFPYHHQERNPPLTAFQAMPYNSIPSVSTIYAPNQNNYLNFQQPAPQRNLVSTASLTLAPYRTEPNPQARVIRGNYVIAQQVRPPVPVERRQNNTPANGNARIPRDQVNQQAPDVIDLVDGDREESSSVDGSNGEGSDVDLTLKL